MHRCTAKRGTANKGRIDRIYKFLSCLLPSGAEIAKALLRTMSEAQTRSSSVLFSSVTKPDDSSFQYNSLMSSSCCLACK